jgi:hypothetical protein
MRADLSRNRPPCADPRVAFGDLRGGHAVSDFMERLDAPLLAGFGDQGEPLVRRDEIGRSAEALRAHPAQIILGGEMARFGQRRELLGGEDIVAEFERGDRVVEGPVLRRRRAILGGGAAGNDQQNGKDGAAAAREPREDYAVRRGAL